MKSAVFQIKSAVLALIASVLAMTTVVLSGAPLMVLRRFSGRWSFLFWNSVCVILLYFVGGVADAAIFGTLALLVMFYTELEEHASILLAGTVSVSLAVGFAVSVFWFWASQKGFQPQVVLESRVDQMIKDMGDLASNFTMDRKSVLGQLPSGLVIVISVTLWLGLLLERPLSRTYFPFLRERRKLSEFRVPDECIWILIGSTAGTFIDFKSPVTKMVASNVFNVAVLIYFFQGLSVTDAFFERIKMSRPWKAFSYAFLIAYFFFVISLLGVLDYWFNFRSRLSKNRPETLA